MKEEKRVNRGDKAVRAVAGLVWVYEEKELSAPLQPLTVEVKLSATTTASVSAHVLSSTTITSLPPSYPPIRAVCIALVQVVFQPPAGAAPVTWSFINRLDHTTRIHVETSFRSQTQVIFAFGFLFVF